MVFDVPGVGGEATGAGAGVDVAFEVVSEGGAIVGIEAVVAVVSGGGGCGECGVGEAAAEGG